MENGKGKIREGHGVELATKTDKIGGVQLTNVTISPGSAGMEEVMEANKSSGVQLTNVTISPGSAGTKGANKEVVEANKSSGVQLTNVTISPGSAGTKGANKSSGVQLTNVTISPGSAGMEELMEANKSSGVQLTNVTISPGSAGTMGANKSSGVQLTNVTISPGSAGMEEVVEANKSSGVQLTNVNISPGSTGNKRKADCSHRVSFILDALENVTLPSPHVAVVLAPGQYEKTMSFSKLVKYQPGKTIYDEQERCYLPQFETSWTGDDYSDEKLGITLCTVGCLKALGEEVKVYQDPHWAGHLNEEGLPPSDNDLVVLEVHYRESLKDMKGRHTVTKEEVEVLKAIKPSIIKPKKDPKTNKIKRGHHETFGDDIGIGFRPSWKSLDLDPFQSSMGPYAVKKPTKQARKGVLAKYDFASCIKDGKEDSDAVLELVKKIERDFQAMICGELVRAEKCILKPTNSTKGFNLYNSGTKLNYLLNRHAHKVERGLKESIDLLPNTRFPAAFFNISHETKKVHTEKDMSYTLISVPLQETISYEEEAAYTFNFYLCGKSIPTHQIPLVPGMVVFFSGFLAPHRQAKLENADVQLVNMSAYGNKSMYHAH